MVLAARRDRQRRRVLLHPAFDLQRDADDPWRQVWMQGMKSRNAAGTVEFGLLRVDQCNI